VSYSATGSTEATWAAFNPGLLLGPKSYQGESSQPEVHVSRARWPQSHHVRGAQIASAEKH
jgi:hypothetical protein